MFTNFINYFNKKPINNINQTNYEIVDIDLINIEKNKYIIDNKYFNNKNLKMIDINKIDNKEENNTDEDNTDEDNTDEDNKEEIDNLDNTEEIDNLDNKNSLGNVYIHDNNNINYINSYLCLILNIFVLTSIVKKI